MGQLLTAQTIFLRGVQRVAARGSSLEIPEHIKKHWSVISEIEDQTDRGAAIIGATYLEERLRKAIESCFVSSLDADVVKTLFGRGGAPLSTLSAKIDMAYVLGLVGEQTRNDLHLIRKIRDRFAHAFDPLTFKNAAVQRRCDELWIPKNILWPGKDQPPRDPRSQFLTAVYVIFNLLRAEVSTVDRQAKAPQLTP